MGMKRKKTIELKYMMMSISSVCAVLIIWWLCIDVLHLKSESVFPGPGKVLNTFIIKLTHKAPDGATLITHTLQSLKVALTGYAMGAVIGIPMGILMAWNRFADMFIRPLFDLLRPIPGLAWIPLFILLFGIGLLPKALVIFIASLIACVVNAYTGIRQTKDLHLWVGDVFGASDMQKLFKIAIPTATPMIFTGLRVALGSAWTALVAAELLASSNGLGYMIQQARSISRPDLVIVGMITIGIVGLVLDRLLHKLELVVAKGMNVQ